MADQIAVKIQQANVAASNYAIMTFNVTGQSEVFAETVAALVIAMQNTNVMAQSQMLDITKRTPGVTGPGLPLVPDLDVTNSILARMASDLNGANLGNAGTDSVLGVFRGSGGGQLPLGTSILVVETAVAGPKGRTYVPFIPTTSLEGSSGRVTPTTLEIIRNLFKCAYGLLPGQASTGVSFYVQSRKNNTASAIAECVVSPTFATLKSRKR